MQSQHRILALRHASLATALLLVSGLLAACSARSPRYRNNYPTYSTQATQPQPVYGTAQPVQQQPVQGGPVAQPPPGNAQAAIQNADRVLRAQGYAPSAAPMMQPLPPHALISFPIFARPGLCYAVFAVGDAGVTDVDMTVVSSRGVLLGQDTNPDAHPHVEFCAFEGGRHLARVSVLGGSGNVTFFQYQGATRAMANLAAAFGTAGPATAGPQLPTTPDPMTGARIQRLRGELMAAGYNDIQPVAAEPVTPGQTLPVNATLPTGLCYAFATFGGPGVTDSDVFLFDGTGSRQLAGDARTDVDAQIRDICPDTTAAYQIRLRLFQGNGPVWFLAMSRPNRTAAAAPVAQNSPLTLVRQQSSEGGIDGVFNRLSRDLQARGFEPPAAPVSGTLTTGASTQYPLNLPPGSCYAIAAIGDSTVQDLDLSVLDAGGAEVDRDYTHDAAPTLRVCPTAATPYSLHVSMVAGQGPYRLAVFRWDGGTSGAGMQGVLFLRNAEVTRVLQADGFTGDPDFDVARARMQEGHANNHSVSLHANTCYAFVAVGGPGVGELHLSVLQGRTSVAESNDLTAYPVARYCAQANGAHAITIRAVRGSGDVVFRVFRQQAPGQS